MDQVLFNSIKEREGNNSWLKYRLMIGYDFEDLVIRLDTDHNGYAGRAKDSQMIVLSQEKENLNVAHVLELVDDWCGSKKTDFYSALGAMISVGYNPLRDLCFRVADAKKGIISAGIMTMIEKPDVEQATYEEILVELRDQYSDNQDRMIQIFGEELINQITSTVWLLERLN